MGQNISAGAKAPTANALYKRNQRRRGAPHDALGPTQRWLEGPVPRVLGYVAGSSRADFLGDSDFPALVRVPDWTREWPWRLYWGACAKGLREALWKKYKEALQTSPYISIAHERIHVLGITSSGRDDPRPRHTLFTAEVEAVITHDEARRLGLPVRAGEGGLGVLGVPYFLSTESGDKSTQLSAFQQVSFDWGTHGLGRIAGHDVVVGTAASMLKHNLKTKLPQSALPSCRLSVADTVRVAGTTLAAAFGKLRQPAAAAQAAPAPCVKRRRVS